ncbi:hypothetical protein LDO11_08635 [Luteimonas sp. MHLX1A]|nr:hypothetical protein [Luteimonas sp. MHLX1A]
MRQWPPHSTITLYSRDKSKVLATSKRSRLALSEYVHLDGQGDAATYLITVSVDADDWDHWTLENVEKIEGVLRYDLTSVGIDVAVVRKNRPGRMLCRNAFAWELKVWLEDVPAEPGRYAGLRFKAAKKTASVKTIQKRVETVFGLPRGSVQLITPGKKAAAPKSTVGDLREQWSRSGT